MGKWTPILVVSARMYDLIPVSQQTSYRGIKNPESVERKKKKQEEMEKQEMMTSPSGGGGLKVRML